MQFRFSAENRRDLETGEMFSGLENQDYTVPVFESRGGACGSKTLLNDDRVEPHRSRVSVHKSMVWEGQCQRNHLLRSHALWVLSHRYLGLGQIN